MLELRSYQYDMVNFIIKNARCNIFAMPGLGKTVSALTAIDCLLTIGDQKGPVLILAPLRVCNAVWAQEIAKWPHLINLTVSVITGTTKQRFAALHADADIYVTNYENLLWLTSQGDWKFTMVVADEVTRLKSFRTRQGGKAAMALAKVAHTVVKRWVGMTGTPISNGIKDAWPTQWFVDKGEALGKTHTAFMKRWFVPDYNGFNYQPLAHAQEEIQDAIAPLTLSLRSEDNFDLNKPIVNIIEVELPIDARELYKSMEKHFFVELSGGEDIGGGMTVDALNAAAKSQKLLQLANGAIYLEDKTFKVVHDAKLDALSDLLDSIDEPVLCVYHFQSDLVRLQARFPSARVLDSSGSVLVNWSAGNVPLLLVNAASAGHGLSLQHGGRTIVFFAVNWSAENHLQVLERLGPVRQLQSGYKRSVFVHYLLAKCTIDAAVMDRLNGKISVQTALMKAMARV